MSATESPVFIIVGALMAIVGITIVMNITTGFFAGEADHSDEQQFRSLLNSIEDKCRQLEDVGEIHFSDTVEVELRGANIVIVPDQKQLILDPDDENAYPEDINCDADIESNIAGNSIETGTHRIILTENNGVIEVSN